MYASKKAKITCCSELRKWSPKTPFSGGVSCWHLPYQNSICPQRTLKCTLKMKITCCSELWKWLPKTPFSGGVSCWHLPYQRSTGPQISGITWVFKAFHGVQSAKSDLLKVRIRRGSVAGIPHIREALALRFRRITWVFKVWKNLEIHAIPEIWGPMFLW